MTSIKKKKKKKTFAILNNYIFKSKKMKSKQDMLSKYELSKEEEYARYLAEEQLKLTKIKQKSSKTFQEMQYMLDAYASDSTKHTDIYFK